MSKVQVYSLEYYVSAGCNNCCVGCSHGAPLHSGFISPEVFERDLTDARRALDVHRFALSGGEPLLHPRLEELMDIARFSGLSKEVMVLTNGTLLDRQPESFWKKLDVLRISRYPGQLTDEQVKEYERKTRANGAEFFMLSLDTFYKPLTRGERDAESARRVFEGCPFFNKCMALHEGRFYPCSQAFFYPSLMGTDTFIDSLPLAGLTTERLREFMARKTPLVSCRRCSYTEKTAWRQTTRARWVEESTECATS